MEDFMLKRTLLILTIASVAQAHAFTFPRKEAVIAHVTNGAIDVGNFVAKKAVQGCKAASAVAASAYTRVSTSPAAQKAAETVVTFAKKHKKAGIISAITVATVYALKKYLGTLKKHVEHLNGNL